MHRTHILIVLFALAAFPPFIHAQAASGGDGSQAATLLDIHQDGDSRAASVEKVDPPRADFSKGSWAFQTYGSVTVGESDGWLYQGHVGAGYFVFKGFSFNVEATLGRIDAADRGGDFMATGLDLLLRWHVLRNDDFSFYLEGGAGGLVSNESFPAHGTHFNFTPQLGLGMTFRIHDKARLMLGARWHHISNGRIYGNGRNPGYEGIMTYAGLMIPF